MSRIYLSPPFLTGSEAHQIGDALTSGWVAPVGPALRAFEAETATATGRAHAVALASGTAALHLALEAMGVSRGDRVVTSTLTFVATVNPIAYLGAQPVLMDVCGATWTLDPELLRTYLERARARRQLPRAVIAVDLYGQCADYDELSSICGAAGVPLIEDAAEALGSRYRAQPAGSFGACAALSFNGNKIITTGGGGMLVTDDEAVARRVRFLGAHAREPVAHYEHREVGFNYGLSNVLAALGRAQLATLADRVERRRAIADFYRGALAGEAGLSFMPQADDGRSNCWLTCILVDPDEFGATPEDVRRHLETLDIESRRLWKPMHLQPVYRQAETVGGAVAEALFRRGLCLPSGTGMTTTDLERVVEGVTSTPRRGRRRPGVES